MQKKAIQSEEITTLDKVKSLIEETKTLQSKLTQNEHTKISIKNEAKEKIEKILDDYGLRVVIPFDKEKNELIHTKVKSAFLDNPNIINLDIEIDYKLEFKV